MDQQHIGIINHQDYLDFLKVYMGRERPMEIDPTKVVKLVQSQELIPSLSSKLLTDELPVSIPVKIKDSQGLDSIDYTPSANQYSSKRQQSFKSIISQSYNPLQQFGDLITNQIIQKCQEYDKDKDGSLNLKQIQSFFYNIVELQYNSIDFIINNYFNFQIQSTVPYVELTEIICEVHFRQIFSTLIHNQLQILNPNKILMKSDYFKRKVSQNCYFFQTKPSQNLLELVFQELKNKSLQKHKEQITLEDFRSYILEYCCKNKLVFKHQANRKVSNFMKNAPSSIVEVQNSHFEQDGSQSSEVKVKQHESSFNKEEIEQMRCVSYKKTKDNKFSQQSISPAHQNLSQPKISTNKEFNSINLSLNQYKCKNEQNESLNFKDLLWRFLKNIISKYCQNRMGWITDVEFRYLLNQQHLFREDKLLEQLSSMLRKNKQIEIQFIVGYIIHYKGQQALRKFSRKQIKGKSTLILDQISHILQDAYGFLSHDIKLFQQCTISLLSHHHNNQLTYKDYLQLIGRNFSIKNSF